MTLSMIKSYAFTKGCTHCDYCPFSGLLDTPDACRKYVKLLLDVDCRYYNMTTIKVQPQSKP